MHNHERTNSYLGPDGAPYHGGHLLHNLILFGRLCHALGMDITPNRMIEVSRALEFIDVSKKQDVYHTLRTLMVTRKRDLELFDEAFKHFWQKPAEGWTTLDLQSLGEKRHKKKTQFLPPPGASPENEHSPEPKPAADPKLIAVVPTYSQQEALRYKDFAEMTREEMLMAQRIMERLPWSLGRRTVRRMKPGKGATLDMRRALRENMKHSGEIINIPTRVRKIKPRPLVVISDISGSMERYTRMLLHFTFTLANSIYQVEAFVFSTNLSHITRQIERRSIDEALTEVGNSVNSWGGGTNTGASLHDFNYHWGRRVLGRGAVVILITDGWDRGEPDELRKEMARLQRNCYRLIWLNPLLEAPEYEPLTRGAQAMLPFVDDFLPIRNLANLETLVRKLWRVSWRRPERPSYSHLIQTTGMD
ncbi:MAG: VWA domain-containing protein [Chloroflexi bacterium]|nr:MAG: CoxE [Phototrophicales bacterium]RMF79705.1 MAG: VWA domain-containing protein [Chloroflexota bacterium]